MSLGYVLRPQADRDLDTIADYLAEEAGLDLGLIFLEDAFKTFSLLADHPEIGWPCNIPHPALAGVRTFRISEKFDRYLVFYIPNDGRVEMLRVLHGSQDLLALGSQFL